jgi:hypothetical protein
MSGSTAIIAENCRILFEEVSVIRVAIDVGAENQ